VPAGTAVARKTWRKKSAFVATFSPDCKCNQKDRNFLGVIRNSFDQYTFMAGSSMRLVRLKPQGPGPDKGPDRPVQKHFYREKISSLLKFVLKQVVQK